MFFSVVPSRTQNLKKCIPLKDQLVRDFDSLMSCCLPAFISSSYQKTKASPHSVVLGMNTGPINEITTAWSLESLLFAAS